MMAPQLLTPPQSPASDADTNPASDAETDFLPAEATVKLDLPDPLPRPTEDDLKAPRRQFTLMSGDERCITMIETIGPPASTKVDCVLRDFAVRAEVNRKMYRDMPVEIMVCINDANSGEDMTDSILYGHTTITGVQDFENPDKTILASDFPIRGLQISQEGDFYFTYWFIDPDDATRAFWDLKGGPCKAAHHGELCKHTTSFHKSQLTPRIISGT